MISYINHQETEDAKAHTDIMLNNEYIGYYIKANEVITAFIEIYGEMNSGEFTSIKQIERTIKQIIG
jgi:hypothetical protein